MHSAHNVFCVKCVLLHWNAVAALLWQLTELRGIGGSIGGRLDHWAMMNADQEVHLSAAIRHGEAFLLWNFRAVIDLQLLFLS